MSGDLHDLDDVAAEFGVDLNVPCWCDDPCKADPCPTREHWLDVEDSELPEDGRP